MNILAETYKKTGTIHHAYAFEGEKASVALELFKFLEKDFEIEIKNNPDFSYQEFETFTIDDGRALQERHGRRALAGKKIFIISTRFVTIEAQNSLLKIFEEPSKGTHFFLIMPNTQVLIPTLRSRLVIVDRAALAGDLIERNGRDISETKNSEAKSLVKKFLAASTAERLALVKNIVEEKDKGKAIDFVTALEEVLATQLDAHERKSNKTELTENAGALAEILNVKKYLHDRAPSVKLLLEHLCLFVTISKP
ncbi:MAG: hypothetical protein WAV56_02205 [Microgenomates group bacterium]